MEEVWGLRGEGQGCVGWCRPGGRSSIVNIGGRAAGFSDANIEGPNWKGNFQLSHLKYNM